MFLFFFLSILPNFVGKFFSVGWGVCSLFHETEEDGEDEIYDLAQMTMGCGRRGDSLKMAFGWIYYGKDGYQGTVLFFFFFFTPLSPCLWPSSSSLLSSSAAFCLLYGVVLQHGVVVQRIFLRGCA